MADFGVTDAGFILKQLSDIILETEEAFKSLLGDAINLDDRGPLGQIKGVLDKAIAEIWEGMEGVHDSQYPPTAEETGLDRVCALTGVLRLAAQKSTIASQLVYGTLGTVIPAGTVFSLEGDETVRFVTVSEVTLVSGVDEVQTITFSGTPTSGSFKLNYRGSATAAIDYADNAAAVQAALNALSLLSGVTVTGSFAADFVVTFEGDDEKQDHEMLTISDNTLDDGGAVTIGIAETVAGVPQGETTMLAEATGEWAAAIGTLNVIETPVSGLTNTKNAEAATEGQDIETDGELRTRRQLSVTTAGHATFDAIISELLALTDVQSASIYENDTIATDGDGRPPKSYECVVWQGDDTDIANKIFETKPVGIETVSTQSGGSKITEVVSDSQGNPHTIYFSRPDFIDIYIEFDVSVDSTYPADGDDQIKAAVVDYGATLGVGADVIVYPKLIGALDDIQGLTNIVTRIGTAPSPTLDDNIIISAMEVSNFIAANIIVAVV